MKKGTHKKHASLSGYAIFFLTTAVTVTVAMFSYGFVNEKSGGNTAMVAVFLLLIVLTLSALMTVSDVIRRRIMVERPVRRILEATDRIAAGDFSVRLHTLHAYEKYDDYDLIMENLNKMAAELGKSEILKTDFISNVSHELKTPLAIVQNYATLLQSEQLDPETRKKYTQTLIDATKRLTGLVTNILRLNKLENRALAPESETFSLDRMLAECVLHFEELIEQKALELTCDIEENVCVHSAPSYLELVWNNLLSNAIKFTEQGGSIGVSLRTDGGNAVVSVTDSGCGISPEIGARIFDKFYQGETSHVGEGNGLGLAMVKRVIDVLGGEITVKSEVGKGSTFRIVLKNVVSGEHYGRE